MPRRTVEDRKITPLRGVDTCIMCGRYVPEGRNVCVICEWKIARERSVTSYERVASAFYETIAVDFDGTLCENSFPEIGQAKPLVIAYIKRQAERGAKIILHTCRENGTRRALLDEAIEFCAAHEIPIYAVNENPDNEHSTKYGTQINGRKVYADLYIDDKAVNTKDIETLMEREREGL